MIGPDHVPVILDPAEAQRLPALSVLSVIAHGEPEHALEENEYEYQSATFRRIRVEGKLESLEVLLNACALHVEDAVRARLRSCDEGELDTLIVRATTIQSLDELFEA